MKKQEKFVSTKERALCKIYSSIWQGTLDNFFTNEEETSGNRVVVLQKDSENNTDEACDQRGYFKENGNKKNTFILNRKEIVEITGRNNEESGLGKFDAHRTHLS